ncbi:MAG TPA: hypothetical protein VGL16_12290 [Actinomycetota bacterium]|jgi:DNA invertase Pin-like site-specific DNA recombinase
MAAKKDPREARARELLAKGRTREEVAHELELTVTQVWAIAVKPGTEKQRANQRKVLERMRRELPALAVTAIGPKRPRKSK